MRNTIISLVTFVLIFVYGTFSFIYIGKFVNTFENDVKAIEFDNSASYKQIETAKDTFKNKKNMLLLMISKEHVDDMENYLSSLDVAIKFESTQDIDEYKILLLNSIENVREHNAKLN